MYCLKHLTKEVAFILIRFTKYLFLHKIFKVVTKIRWLVKLPAPKFYKPGISGICSQTSVYLWYLLLLLIFLYFYSLFNFFSYKKTSRPITCRLNFTVLSIAFVVFFHNTLFLGQLQHHFPISQIILHIQVYLIGHMEESQ